MGRLAHPLGNAEFTIRNQTIRAVAQPYRFYLLQRVQSVYEGLSADEKLQVKKLLDACGMTEILTLTLNKTLTRIDNLEVWQS